MREIDDYPFVDRTVLARAKAAPNWFLYNLLVYDLWHKAFLRVGDRAMSNERRTASDGLAPAWRIAQGSRLKAQSS